MSAADDALATLNGFKSLLLEGKTMRSDVAKVLRDATIERTIDGASTLVLELHDDARKLLRSGVFSERTTMQVDDFSFELVQVRKSGPGLSVTLEDLPVAALRRHDSPLKVAPGTVNHVDFAERLVKEEAWLQFWTPASVRTGERTKVEMARGKPATEGEEEAEREDTWVALGRFADARGWRRYVLNKDTIAYVPETYLISQPAAYVLKEQQDGVENIDFDFDIGKPVASVKVRVRAARWAVPVGTVVEIEDLGPANGKWLVQGISRSLFSLFLEVSLTRARPVLPEPEAQESPSSEQLGEESGSIPEGAPVTPGAVLSSQGFVWPVQGRVSSEFGPRSSPGGVGSTSHGGIDIAASTGTKVVAARGGTVVLAGVAGGYGNAVYIDNRDGIVTRYGHLHRISVRRGVRVAAGEQIGEVGMTGTATGPHLHFEVRVGGAARNPRNYLP